MGGLDVGTDTGRTPLRTSSVDPLEDALANYSSIGVVGPGRTNLAGGDFTGVEVGPEVDLESGEPIEDGGFTVTMTVDDLSDGALNDAMVRMATVTDAYLSRFPNAEVFAVGGPPGPTRRRHRSSVRHGRRRPSWSLRSSSTSRRRWASPTVTGSRTRCPTSR